jgi:hypothetical protein
VAEGEVSYLPKGETLPSAQRDDPFLDEARVAALSRFLVELCRALAGWIVH